MMNDNLEITIKFIQETKNGKYTEFVPKKIDQQGSTTYRDDTLLDQNELLLYNVTNHI